MSTFFDDKLKEKLEVLAGSRPGSIGGAAIRIDDLATLLEIEQLQSVDLTAAPTMADMNKLIADVRNISRTLNAVALAITKKKISR